METLNEGLLLFLVGLGALTAAWGMWRTARRFVHFFDSMERFADRVDVAVGLIITEFRPNGGRLEQPLHGEFVNQATIKDLLLDVRSSLRHLRDDLEGN